MLGLCLALLMGGAPQVAPASAVPDPAAQRLHPAVVVPEDALEGASVSDEPDPSEDSPAPESSGKAPEGPSGTVTLRKAAVVRTS
jgi:hypothetical protein